MSSRKAELNPVHLVKEWLRDETPTTRGEMRMRFVPTATVLAVTVVVGFFSLQSLSTRQAEAVQQFAEANVLTQCLTRVETRDSLRSVLFSITAQFPDSPSVEAIGALINSEYPPLDPKVICYHQGES